MVPVALGTQTQGSLLRPASYCGVFGFKPTVGTLHTGGIHPLSATCDHLGVIAGTLEDAWSVASEISLGAGSPGQRFLSSAGTRPVPVKPSRIVRLYTRGWSELHAETQQAFDDLIAFLETRGVEIADRGSDSTIAALEEQLDEGMDGALAIVAYEMKWPYAEYIAKHRTRVGPRIHELVDRAKAMRPAEYEALLAARARMQDAIEQQTRSSDALVTLAASGPAPVGLQHTGSRTFQVYASWLGLPAFTLPLLEEQGLPVGVQLLGGLRNDAKLCGVASWIAGETRTECLNSTAR
jgi:Asp-tRNA(Asn)/Glu-tRNA(Gln) amidotransferase A subunit family amidase